MLNLKMESCLMILSFLLLTFGFHAIASSQNQLPDQLPELFLFLDGADVHAYQHLLENPYVSGAQIIYSWKVLESQKNQYDFSKILHDLAFLNTMHKKLFIQLQDRSFQPTVFNVPDYLRTDPIYHGGVAMQYDFSGEGKSTTTGWVARVWDPAVQERYHLLVKHLAATFDGKIDGINLPETAVDFDKKNPPKDFTPERYFNAEYENLLFVRHAFSKSHVVQYVNFFPDEWNNDHQYMSRLFSGAYQQHIGLGGPDIVPYRKGQMKNSYPFFHQFKEKILIAMAIQEPDYTYRDPNSDQRYRFNNFYEFSKTYLGARILFWNTEEPFLSTQLLPHLNEKYFSHCSVPVISSFPNFHENQLK